MAIAKATVEGIFVPNTPGVDADVVYNGGVGGGVGWLLSINIILV